MHSPARNAAEPLLPLSNIGGAAGCDDAHCGTDTRLKAVRRRMRGLTQAGISSPDDVLAAAVRGHFTRPGKQVRAKLALATARRLGLSEADGIAIAACVQLLHEASLIHDDLQDRDPQRRGRPAIWQQFGDDVAVCAGDLLISASFAALASVNTGANGTDLTMTVHRRVSRTIAGQTLDRQVSTGPATGLGVAGCQPLDFARYERIVAAKSGPLLGLPMEICFLRAGLRIAARHAAAAGEYFALAYQLVDDLADMESDRQARGQSSALNGIWVLVETHRLTLDAAIATVRRRATYWLQEADRKAAALPACAADILQEPLVRLADRLREEASHHAS